MVERVRVTCGSSGLDPVDRRVELSSLGERTGSVAPQK